ncbi:hypothetical protein pb186bvf_002980 [Paramecium bursaria]
MIIIAILIRLIQGYIVNPSLNKLPDKEGFSSIKLSCQNFPATNVGLFTVAISSQYNIPIICQTLTVFIDDIQMTAQFNNGNCKSFSFYVYNTRNTYILQISSYYIYALIDQFDIALEYSVGNQILLQVKKPLQGSNLFMKDYNSYTDQNITGTITNLYLSYTPQWYLLKCSYFELQFYYRDFQNLENANIIPFTSLTPKCVGVKGINANIYCYIQGNSLYIQNVVDYQLVPQQVLIKIEGFITAQNMFSYLLGMQFYLYQTLFDVFHLFEQNQNSVQLPTTQINNKLTFNISLSNNQVSQYNEITFTINYYDFLYSWTSIFINFPQNFIADYSKIKVIPLENVIANPPLTQTGNQLQIGSCLPNFLEENSIIRFIISTTNPDIVSIYDNLQLTVEDDEVVQQISQSDFQSIQIAPNLLTVAILSIKDSIVGMITDFQFLFTCNSNLPQNTYIIIELDNSLSLNGNLIPQGINNINTSPNLIVNLQTIRLNGWQTNQQLTANISRSLTIKNIQNPLYITKNQISYSIKIYQQDDKLHDSYTGQLSLTLQQFTITIQSINYNQQITNSIQQLNIIAQIQSNIIKGDQIKIIFTENDYDFELMKSQQQCFIGSFEQVCYKQKGFLMITSQGMFSDSLNIVIRNMVTPRSLKSTNVQIQLQRVGYQVAFSGLFAFKLIDLNIFQKLSLDSYQQLQNSTIQYNFDLQTITDLTIDEYLILKFQEKLEYFIDVGFNATLSKIDNQSTQIQLLEKLISGITYQFKILANDSSSTSVLSFDLTAQTSDQFGILKSSILNQIESGPKTLQQFTYESENHFINSQNNLNLQFRSNFQLFSNQTASLVIPQEFTNLNQIFSMNKTINISFLTNQSSQIITFGLTDIEKGKVCALDLMNITNPSIQKNNLIEYGMLQIGDFTCNNDCLTCEMNNTCLSCQEGFILNNGLCILNCPQDQILYNNSCQSCQTDVQNCKMCNLTNPTECLICKDNLILNEQQCVNNTYNITIQQNNPVNEGKIVQLISQNGESVFEKLYEGLFNYINFIILIIMIIWKIKRKQFKQTQGYLTYLGLCDPVAHFISFIYFILYDQQYQFLITGGLIFIRVVYIVNSQVFLIPQIQAEKQIQRYQHKNSSLKLILSLIKYYDWKISFILNSRILNNKIFKIEYINYDQIKKSHSKLLNWGFIYINPLQIIILILTVSTDAYNTAVFQLEYLIFMILNQLFLIIKAYQLEISKNQDFEGLYSSEIQY